MQGLFCIRRVSDREASDPLHREVTESQSSLNPTSQPAQSDERRALGTPTALPEAGEILGLKPYPVLLLCRTGVLEATHLGGEGPWLIEEDRVIAYGASP